MTARRRGLPAWLVALLACTSPVTERPTARIELALLVPDPASLPAGTILVESLEYMPESLFEPLDGGAKAYLDLGFRALHRTVYRAAGARGALVTLDIFDMGGGMGAFGIYRAGMPEATAVRPWGAEGHREAEVASAWKGRVYVHAEADEETAELVALLELLVGEVCRRIPGGPELPPALRLLPAEGLIPRSERFVARDLLGHSFLPGGIMASYFVDGARAELCFADLGSTGAARAALDSWRAFHAEAGGATDGEAAFGYASFRFTPAAGRPGTAARRGRYVAGVQGGGSRAAQEALLRRLVDALGRE